MITMIRTAFRPLVTSATLRPCNAAGVTEDEDRTITADDVASMNRASIERSAYLARLGGSVLFVVGVLVALGWLWTQIRNQQRLDDYGSSPAVTGAIQLYSARITGVSRVDLLLGSLGGLWLPALAVAGGLALRMLADFVQIRVGGSITGFVEGDVLAVELFADDNADAVEDDR
jgi:hypothetical protein